MELALKILLVQALVGGLDNLWHHEITEDLTHRPSARGELALHAAREFLYAVIFLGLAWFAFHGAWAAILALLFIVEIVITLWDFIVEDQTRRLPKFERVLHTFLAINLGVFLTVLLPVLADWWQYPGQLTAAYYGWMSWVFTAMGIAVLVWSIYDLNAVVRLGVPDWQRNPIRAGNRPDPRRILVTGGTGFIGRHLVRRLIERGDRPVILTRDEAKARFLFGPHVEIITNLGQLHDYEIVDAIVNLAGAPLLGGLWTEKRRRVLIDSRQKTTDEIVDLVARLQRRPAVLISGSAVGYYGTDNEKRFREQDPAGENFSARLCAQWEDTALRAKTFGTRVCLLRMGIVFGPDGGAFPKLVQPIKLGLGAITGSGEQWMSWIHIDDLVRLILFALQDEDAEGAINAVAPDCVRTKAFYKCVAEAAGRKVMFRIPEGILRRILGELAEFFVDGQNVQPIQLSQLGFTFDHPTLDHVIADLVTEDISQDPAAQTCSIYYNDACPICDAEISHYRALTVSDNLALRFNEISKGTDSLKAYRLGVRDLKKRLYLIDAKGELIGGIPAFVEIWQQIPRYRRAAQIINHPAIRPFAEFLYDGILAPTLVIWNNWRHRRKKDRYVHG